MRKPFCLRLFPTIDISITEEFGVTKARWIQGKGRSKIWILKEMSSAWDQKELTKWTHGRALMGSDPHELAHRFEICQMKATHIGASELTLLKFYEFILLRIWPLCVWTIKQSLKSKISNNHRIRNFRYTPFA